MSNIRCQCSLFVDALFQDQQWFLTFIWCRFLKRNYVSNSSLSPFHSGGESGVEVSHAGAGSQSHLVRSPHHRFSGHLFLVPEPHIKKLNCELILSNRIFFIC